MRMEAENAPAFGGGEEQCLLWSFFFLRSFLFSLVFFLLFFLLNRRL